MKYFTPWRLENTIQSIRSSPSIASSIPSVSARDISMAGRIHTVTPSGRSTSANRWACDSGLVTITVIGLLGNGVVDLDFKRTTGPTMQMTGAVNRGFTRRVSAKLPSGHSKTS